MQLIFHHAGYAADTFGYKQVLVVTGTLSSLTGTLLHQVPRYREYQNHPYATLSSDSKLVSLGWPTLCQGGNCSDSDAAQKLNGTKFIAIGNCHNQDGNLVETHTNISLPDHPMNITSMHIEPNGTFCGLSFLDSSMTDITCDIIDDSILPSCTRVVGNHALTLGLYCSIFVVLRFMQNNFLALLDSTAMQYANIYNGSYASSIFFANMGCLISSYVAGALVVDPKYNWDNRNFAWGMRLLQVACLYTGILFIRKKILCVLSILLNTFQSLFR